MVESLLFMFKRQKMHKIIGELLNYHGMLYIYIYDGPASNVITHSIHAISHLNSLHSNTQWLFYIYLKKKKKKEKTEGALDLQRYVSTAQCPLVSLRLGSATMIDQGTLTIDKGG